MTAPQSDDKDERAFETWWQEWRKSNLWSDSPRMREAARAMYQEIQNEPFAHITAAIDKLRQQGHLAEAVVPECGLASFTDEDRRLAEVTVELLTRNWTNRANMSHHQGDLIVRALKSIALSTTQQRGTVVAPEFIEVCKTALEAIRWILRDAAYKHPKEIGDIPQRWLDRLQEVESFASRKLLAPLSATGAPKP